MEHIILIGHGSPKKEANNSFAKLAKVNAEPNIAAAIHNTQLVPPAFPYSISP